MHGTWVIARRELASYSTAPVAYVAATVFLTVAGYTFFGQVFSAGEASLRDFFELCPRLFLLLAPALTMRLLAEERRSRTFEMLLSLPLNEWELVLGKHLAALAVLGAVLLPTLAYPLALNELGDLDWGPVAGGYLGLLLMGSSYLAIGILASSWTSNQALALVGALAISLPLYVVGAIAEAFPPGPRALLSALDLGRHFDNLARGIVDSRDLVYYLTLTIACLFLATQALEQRERD
ncbi:MAG: ABC transporter permease subunit [Proteobacteria bacterium]|nr:ABC transporter permease subunit [Pseudomonadota bacterium]